MGGASTSLKKALASREKEAWGLTVLRCSSGLLTESGDAEKIKDAEKPGVHTGSLQ